MSKKRRTNQPARQQQSGPNQSQRRAAVRTDRGELLLHEQQYSGPLPDAADFHAYDLVLPGSAERIMTQFEDQGQHRRQLEAIVVGGSERRAERGQWLGFILILAAIICGTVVAVAKDARYGAAMVGAALASGAVIYIVGGRVDRGSE